MPAGRIWIELAVIEPSLLAVPVMVTAVPTLRSLALPAAVLRICVDGPTSTISVLEPFCCCIDMVPLPLETMVPAVKPPAAPPRAPVRPAKPPAPPPALKVPRAAGVWLPA